MRLGLLQCDHVLPELRDIGGDYDAMFAKWLPVDWQVYDVTQGEAPEDLGECDGWVSTGSTASVYDDEPWVQHFRHLVRRLHREVRPFLGVCFGHQMIAEALDGKVSRTEHGWGVGAHRFSVLQNEPWMNPPLAGFDVLMSCRDQVERLPSGAQVLAGNAHCPVGMYRTGTLLGIQGHPEFPPAYAAALLALRRDAIGGERVDAALATLKQPLHSDELAGWVLNYLGGERRWC